MNRKIKSTGATKVRKSPGRGKKQFVKSGFPIIGIGASAGGLEAFEVFFKQVPADSGMAFILVSHLDPAHSSMLAEILQRITAIPVIEAANQMTVEPDHVYIIPPNREMTIFHGELHLSFPPQPRGLRMPIDTFLRSLAEDDEEKAIAVILSGSGTDGTLGLRAIQGSGGVSFVQDPASAKYDGMPASAIQSGLATYVLPVEKIFGEIETYVRNYITRKIPLPPPFPEGKSFAKILMLLRTKTGHDFSLYKQNTIRRRIERRMGVHNLEDPDAYARYLAENPSEVHLLFKELLINVTSFFREPEAFEVLKTEILPAMFQDKPENYVFRVWVAGCATGEEAFSIAMIFRECFDVARHQFRVQIYSTDIDDDAIAVARGGVYPSNIAIDVTAERLRRFFTKEETGFRIKKEIREMVVFAVQDMIKDPPFTRLDLLSCRNLLIYFEPELQNRLIPSFHYSLKSGGILFLSPSESIGRFTDLFTPVSRKWKIYSTRQSLSPVRTAGIPGLPVTAGLTGSSTRELATKKRETNFVELTRGILLQSYAPPSVITDNEGNTLYVYGDTGNYLRPAPGQASLNIIEMAREGLQLKLRKAIHDAAHQKTPVTIRGLPFRTPGGVHPLDIIVRPLSDPGTAGELLLVSFLESMPQEPAKPLHRKKPDKSGQSKRVEELEQELLYTKENLQENLIQMQTANEELKSTNEEFQSTNEELQSTNEELETSKEELQSVNEEIVTVNAELQAKIEQLTDIQNDMKNLLDSTSIGTIFLDENLAVKRFTRDATRVFRLVTSDAGRPLSDIRSTVVSGDIVADAQEVLDTMVPREHMVQTSENLWYLARLTPYRTFENVIDGVVITFTDITALKSMEAEVRHARELAENIIDTIREPLVILDPGFRVVSASRTFYTTFRTVPGETTGRSLFELGDRQWDIPRLRELLETVLPENTIFEDVEVEHEFPGIGVRKMLLNGRRVLSDRGEPRFILLAMEDITSRTPAKRTIKKGQGD
jgi:two-component system CheB/CheR fusion protein